MVAWKWNYFWGRIACCQSTSRQILDFIFYKGVPGGNLVWGLKEKQIIYLVMEFDLWVTD